MSSCPTPIERVDVMCRMLPYLPLFLALSTSSPFWQSRRTGLKGYRLAAYDELPRTGVPELFRTKEEFDAYVAALVRAGVMEDSSYVWWAIRPSLKHPDARAARARLLHAGRGLDRDRGALPHARAPPLLQSLAQRRHRRGLARDRGREQVAGAALRRARHLRDRGRRRDGRRDARPRDRGDRRRRRRARLRDEIRRCRPSSAAGTSADAQLAVYEAHHKDRATATDALRAVTDWIAGATLQ